MFAGALFYLLAAEEDLLAAAAGLLPLSGAARAHVVGVLAGTIKCVLHPLLVRQSGRLFEQLGIAAWLKKPLQNILHAWKQYNISCVTTS